MFPVVIANGPSTPKSSFQPVKRFLIILCEDIPVIVYLAVFSLIAVAFAWGYSLLIPYNNGIQGDATTLATSPFLNSLYFSLVTISSLGYGDLHPVGYAKVLACSEVLIGLGFMGLIVARITSRRISYHVARLFSAEAHRRLDHFAATFEDSRDRLRTISERFSSLYQTTPGREPNDNSSQIEASIDALRTCLSRFHSNSSQLVVYFTDETDESNFFKIVPPEAIIRVGISANEALYNLGQLIISLPPHAKNTVFPLTSRQRVSEILDFQKRVSDQLINKSGDISLISCFNQVTSLCDSVIFDYFYTPIIAADQPDQQITSPDTPEG